MFINSCDYSQYEIPKNSDFIKIVSRKSCLLIRSIWVEGTTNKELYLKNLGYEFSYTSYYFERGVFHDRNLMNKDLNILCDFHNKDSQFLLKLAHKCECDGNKLIDFSKKIKQLDITKLNKNELISYFKRWYEMMINFDVFLMMPHVLQSYFEKTVLEKVNGNKKYFEVLCSPIKHNIDFYEQKNILQLATQYKGGMSSNLQNEIKKHVFDFGQIGLKSGIGALWTYDDVLNRIKYLAESNPKEKLEKILDFDKLVQKGAKEILDMINVDNKFRNFVEIVRTFVWLRTFRMDVLSGCLANIVNLFAEIAKRNNLEIDDIFNCFPEEIIKQEFLSKDEIYERKKTVLFGCNGDIFYCFGKQSKKIRDKLVSQLEPQVNLTNELKGTCANPGKIQGKVKVLLDNSHVDKVNQGDIIVAPMTTPDFIQAMEKAAGFVTDEGGILCHAAIVSREMNKPCIIGTKHATQAFKDGDLVELDAEKEKIKKI